MKNLSLFSVHLAALSLVRYFFPKLLSRSEFFWYLSFLALFCHAILAVPDVVGLVHEELHFHMHRHQRLPRQWYCGSGDINSYFAGVWASLFSGLSLHEVNECCYAHDMQYDLCVDKTAPDEEFRQCLMQACDEEDFSCSYLVGELFASVVEYVGFIAYSQECGVGWIYGQS